MKVATNILKPKTNVAYRDLAMPFYTGSNSQLQDSENCSFRELPVLGIDKVSFICLFNCQNVIGGAEGSNEMMSYCVNMNT